MSWNALASAVDTPVSDALVRRRSRLTHTGPFPTVVCIEEFYNLFGLRVKKYQYRGRSFVNIGTRVSSYHSAFIERPLNYEECNALCVEKQGDGLAQLVAPVRGVKRSEDA